MVWNIRRQCDPSIEDVSYKDSLIESGEYNRQLSRMVPKALFPTNVRSLTKERPRSDVPTRSEHIACEPGPGHTISWSWGPRWDTVPVVTSGCNRSVPSIDDDCAGKRLCAMSVCMYCSARTMNDRYISSWWVIQRLRILTSSWALSATGQYLQ